MKPQFIDRESELGALEKFWREEGPQLVVLYGKRRVGKTELIKQFIRKKPHIYFLGQRINEKENLRSLGESVGETFGDDVLKRAGFEDWKGFFRYARSHIKERTVLAIDEFPYLAEVNKALSSVFQAGWDEFLRQTPVYLILCGSSVAMMESETLSQKAPLFGRRTGQILLKPFSFSGASGFFPGLPFEKRLEIYSITGGNPSYLKKINPNISLENNIRESILQPESFLYAEVDFLLREELREPRNYLAILKALALSKNRVSEIVNETGLAKGILHKYLFILEDLHIVEKDVPVTEKNPLKSRKGIYKIQDQFIKFWFRYVLPHRGSLEAGKAETVLEKIKTELPSLAAANYESIAGEVVRKHEKRLFPIERLGRWWDRNEEIDIVALNEARKSILFGEAKWSNKAVGVDIFEDLKRKSQLVEWHRALRKEYFCLFSKSGFTENMLTLARDENVLLFTKDIIIESS